MIYLFLTKVTQNTVLLMDFHYSMLLLIERVCYTL